MAHEMTLTTVNTCWCADKKSLAHSLTHWQWTILDSSINPSGTGEGLSWGRWDTNCIVPPMLSGDTGHMRHVPLFTTFNLPCGLKYAGL